jgi:hypothetical protein
MGGRTATTMHAVEAAAAVRAALKHSFTVGIRCRS